jgi:hypothetical protein
MRAPTPPLMVTEPQREVLEALSRSQTAAHRDVQRAKALLMASDGFATTRIAHELGVSPATVTRWRENFEQDGLNGSVKIRPGRDGLNPLAAGAVRTALMARGGLSMGASAGLERFGRHHRSGTCP